MSLRKKTIKACFIQASCFAHVPFKLIFVLNVILTMAVFEHILLDVYNLVFLCRTKYNGDCSLVNKARIHSIQIKNVFSRWYDITMATQPSLGVQITGGFVLLHLLDFEIYRHKF